MQPLPERQRLGVRVVDPEDARRRDRSSDRGCPCTPATEREPVAVVGRPEVDRVDVLVLLRRVLGVADRAVGPVVEPLGVLGDPRVVGRALERVVERDLHAVGRRSRRRSGRSRRWCRGRGAPRCGRPRGRRSPTGCRGRRARGSVLLRPLRKRVPRSGGSAGGRRRRSPSPRWPASRSRPRRSRPRIGGTARTRRRGRQRAIDPERHGGLDFGPVEAVRIRAADAAALVVCRAVARRSRRDDQLAGRSTPRRRTSSHLRRCPPRSVARRQACPDRDSPTGRQRTGREDVVARRGRHRGRHPARLRPPRPSPGAAGRGCGGAM